MNYLIDNSFIFRDEHQFFMNDLIKKSPILQMKSEFIES